MTTVREFRVISRLHPGVDGARYPDVTAYPATQAGLALALDQADYDQVSLRGCYGSIGCGSTGVYGVLDSQDEGAEVPIEVIPGRVLNALPTGTLRVADWQGLCGRVWDGNNHVSVTPHRSRALWAKLQFSPGS